MSLPGERAAWRTIESPLSTSAERADARVKLADVERIRRHNDSSLCRWNERKGSA